MPEGNSSFSLVVPELQLAWDSTSLKALQKCPQYYKYTIVDGWQPRGTAVDLEFGIWFHGACERYDHAKSSGMDHQSALRLAVKWAMSVTWNKALNRGWISDHPQKNRRTLVELVIDYHDRFGETDPFQTVQLANGKPAVELSFKLTLDYTAHQTGEPFLLCGHLDRLAAADGHTYILDRKTTKAALDDRYFEQFSPSTQFACYVFGGKVVYGCPIHGIFVDAAQVTATLGARFERRQVGITEGQLQEWHRALGAWLTLPQMYARAGHWPMNPESCFRCSFRPICSKPPGVREEWLKASFQKRIWDPLIARGDI